MTTTVETLTRATVPDNNPGKYELNPEYTLMKIGERQWLVCNNTHVVGVVRKTYLAGGSGANGASWNAIAYHGGREFFAGYFSTRKAALAGIYNARMVLDHV